MFLKRLQIKMVRKIEDIYEDMYQKRDTHFLDGLKVRK